MEPIPAKEPHDFDAYKIEDGTRTSGPELSLCKIAKLLGKQASIKYLKDQIFNQKGTILSEIRQRVERRRIKVTGNEEPICYFQRWIFLLTLATNHEKLPQISKDQLTNKIQMFIARPISFIKEQLRQVKNWILTKELTQQEVVVNHPKMITRQEGLPRLTKFIEDLLAAEQSKMEIILTCNKQLKEDKAAITKELEKISSNILLLKAELNAQ